MFIAGFFFTVGHPYWGAGDVCVVMCRTREPKQQRYVRPVKHTFNFREESNYRLLEHKG